MTDLPSPDPATNAKGFLPGALGLRLDEEFLPLRILHGTPVALDAILPMHAWRSLDGATTLRVAPDHILMSGEPPEGPFRITDISHAGARMRLRGIEALHFLAQYTTADLFARPTREARVIRTRIAGYNGTIWWSDTRDVHILIARSLAQSFCDALRALARRNDPIDPSHYPRPYAPGAPERRG